MVVRAFFAAVNHFSSRAIVRILLVSDLHYRLPQFDWLVRVAPAFDLIALAGDYLDISSQVSIETQATVILRYLAILQKMGHLAVSSGNHDLTGPDENGEQAALWLASARKLGIPSDGDSLLIGDTLFTICPWWDGPRGHQALETQLARDAARQPARWIWIYHWPPMDSPLCWTGKRHYGDPDLRRWVEQYQPDMVFTGHVHEPPFRPDGAWGDRVGRTWLFNAGSQIGMTPTHITVDIEKGSASWYSLLGSETLDLTAEKAPPRSVF